MEGQEIFHQGVLFMSIKRLYKWQLYLIAFIIAFIFFILGAILGTFLFMKNIDLFAVRERQEYLIKEVEELRKERREIMYIFKERGLIREHNEDAVIMPEEGK